ncbi:salivary glue protein Sgs-3-like [Leguminivora glycinivorella]|uniref:salivary glue protein Sgs-3-like n=1 Tax=Leguminivora glycinivorella TaxID=1035111 RepID=UPI00200D40A1|nr:salivary glue protein Sgs-3-like [Leguminivora glycinivorella]
MKSRYATIVMMTVTLAYSAPIEYEYVSLEVTSSKPIERRNDNAPCCQSGSPSCCPYDYDDACETAKNRTLCGYNKNQKKSDEMTNVSIYGLPCRVNDDRLECGYNGPYITDRIPNIQTNTPPPINNNHKQNNQNQDCCNCCNKETTKAADCITTEIPTTSTTTKPTDPTPNIQPIHNPQNNQDCCDCCNQEPSTVDDCTTTTLPTTTTTTPTTTTATPTKTKKPITTPTPTTTPTTEATTVTTIKTTASTTSTSSTTTTTTTSTTTPKPITTIEYEQSTKIRKLDFTVTKKATSCATVEERCVIIYDSPCIPEQPCGQVDISDE